MDTEKPNRAITPVSVDPVDVFIGERIRRRRESLGMMGETLARRAGVELNRLVKIENGSACAAAGEIYAIASALQVKVHYFYDRAAVVVVPAGKSWMRDVERWFGANISPYERDFLGIARRLTGDLETARDIVHDAYAKVLAGDTWATLTNPRAYLMRAIHNLGLNRLRDARVVPLQQYAKVETVSYADMALDAFEVLSSRQEIQRLMDAISRLPPQCRKVITMRKIDELRPREIAGHLGISLSAVEKHLARGLVLLAEYLDVAEVGKGRVASPDEAASAAEIDAP